MDFGASTFIWASPFGNETLDLIDKVKALNFDIIEICIEQPEKIAPDLVRARLAAAGLKVTVCGAFGPDRDMSAEDPAVRANAVAYLRKCVEIASALGSPTVCGPMYAGVGATALRDAPSRRAQWERAADGLRPVADYAAGLGVRLALEPLNRFETDLINTVEQGLRLLDDIGSVNVGLLIDTFHMNIEEKDIPAAIRRAGKHIFEFHACATDRGTPGEDHLPWREIASALADVSYRGPIVIESFTPEIKEIARAVSLWRPLAESGDVLAANGLAHLHRVFG